MSVLNNVLVGAIYGKSTSRREATKRALESLRVLDLLDKKDIIAAHLTYSDRRLLEIARALAAKPRMVLLDEPLAGLNPTETLKLTAVIYELRNKHGITVLWIEHKMDAILNTCERVVVLDYGRKLAEGRPRDIVNNKQVIEAYLGEPAA